MLWAALTKIMSGQIGAAASLAQTQAFARNEWISSRTILALVHPRYDAWREGGIVSSVTALVSLGWMGDDRMQEFMLRWGQVLQASAPPPPPEEVDRREIFYSQMRET